MEQHATYFGQKNVSWLAAVFREDRALCDDTGIVIVAECYYKYKYDGYSHGADGFSSKGLRLNFANGK